jgi:hypothetical protein
MPGDILGYDVVLGCQQADRLAVHPPDALDRMMSTSRGLVPVFEAALLWPSWEDDSRGR